MISKKILFLCPYPENVAPSQRLKFEQYYPFFRESGYEVKTSAFINKAFWKIIYSKGNFLKKTYYSFLGYLSRIHDLFTIGKYDVVYIHLWVTPFGPPLFEWLIIKFSKRVIYDIDDLIYMGNVKSKSNQIVNFIKGKGKPIWLMKNANHVITCTPYLDNFVKKFNSKTTDISSTINTDIYVPKATYAIKEKIIIGWSGSHSTSKYLHLLDNVFKTLALSHEFKLLVMGDPDFVLEGVDVEAIPWEEQHEINTIKRFDIGVYPLPDEEWVLGKSGLKALQYMALGVPTIATAIGTIFRIINHDDNGLLVNNDQEWIAAIERLLTSENLRKNIGSEAIRTVETSYSINVNKSKYLSVIAGTSDHLLLSDLKVAFFTIFEKDIAPNQRYRIEAFTDKPDISFKFNYFSVIKKKDIPVFYGQSILKKIILAFKILGRRCIHLFSLNNYDAVFIARETIPFGSYFFEYVINKIFKKKIIYDFDDAIWIKKISDGNKRFSFLKSAVKYSKIMRLADVVIAGNEFLAAYANKYNSNVNIIPSCIDLSLYNVKTQSDSNKICIGWSGSETTLVHFISITDVLIKIQSIYGEAVYFKVISSRDNINIPGLNIQSVKWNAIGESEDLEDFDIGIMPLFNDEWSKGKCSMKGIQYMGKGIATVMSNVGTNKQVIQHGINGLLANSFDEWIQCLSLLIDDEQLRKKLGKAGRLTVEQKYSIQEWQTKWVDLLIKK